MTDEERFSNINYRPEPVFSNVLKGILWGAGIGVGWHLLKKSRQEEHTPAPQGPSEENISAILEAEHEFHNLPDGSDTDIWGHPNACADHRAKSLIEVRRDPELWKQKLRLARRWRDLCLRSISVGFCPLVMMPRSVSGDIAGPVELLEAQMDKIEERLGKLESHKAIERRWLET